MAELEGPITTTDSVQLIIDMLKSITENRSIARMCYRDIFRHILISVKDGDIQIRLLKIVLDTEIELPETLLKCAYTHYETGTLSIVYYIDKPAAQRVFLDYFATHTPDDQVQIFKQLSSIPHVNFFKDAHPVTDLQLSVLISMYSTECIPLRLLSFSLPTNVIVLNALRHRAVQAYSDAGRIITDINNIIDPPPKRQRRP